MEMTLYTPTTLHKLNVSTISAITEAILTQMSRFLKPSLTEYIVQPIPKDFWYRYWYRYEFSVSVLL